jgi:hypothetical protein
LSTLAMSEQLQSLTAGSLGDVPWGKKKHGNRKSRTVGKSSTVPII